MTVYPIGIGQLGGDTITPTMVTTVSDKRANPTWTPTANIRARYKAMGIDLPAVMPPARITPWGTTPFAWRRTAACICCTAPTPTSASACASGSGCIRLRDDDIKALYNEITPGTRVTIINTPIKVSVEPNGTRLVEVHQPLSKHIDDDPQTLPITLTDSMQAFKQAQLTDTEVMERAMMLRSGMPIDVTRHHRETEQSL